jgi:putative addiction module component (TIGR02574 family)
VTKEQLLQTAKSLPKGDQIDLALQLWESINVEETDVPVTDAQKRELDRRTAEDAADAAPAEEWPAVRKKLLDGEL